MITQLPKSFFTFMKPLSDDYASGVGSPLSENPIPLRCGPTAAAGVAYGVFDKKNQATAHERARQRLASGAKASPSKRRQPDTGFSVPPPSKLGMGNKGKFFSSTAECSSPAARTSRRRRQRPAQQPEHHDHAK
jgi:hypothetical protein